MSERERERERERKRKGGGEERQIFELTNCDLYYVN